MTTMISPGFDPDAAIQSRPGYGMSEQTHRWDEWMNELELERTAPITNREASVGERFRRLAEQWRKDTEFESSPTILITHPAYQRIIGMGPAVLPYLLEDLERTRSLWFWALRAISDANPVRPDDRGDVEKMALAWRAWAARSGLL